MSILEIRAAQREAKAKNEKAGEMYLFASKQIKCTRCGIVPKKPDALFYKRSGTTMYAAQSDKICLCKECVGKLFDEYVQTYGDTLEALMRICSDLGYYYSEDLANNLLSKKTFTIGKYIQMCNMQYKEKSIADSLKELKSQIEDLVGSSDNIRRRISKWNIEDRKNKDNIVHMIGYDPYIDGGYTDEQLKFLYNTTAGYVTDAIEQDPHKLQNVIMMVKTFLQLDTVDRLINDLLNSPTPDSQSFSALVTTKEKLTSTVTRIANENGFSEKTGGKNSQGNNTLSDRMKRMFDANFELSKVNIHDVNMSETFKAIAAINAHALVDEMNFTGDDYARLCADQRNFVSELQEQNEKVEEENRLLRIEVKDLKDKIRNKKK